MALVDFVHAIRDVNPGMNTPINLDELIALRDDVVYREDWYKKRKPHSIILIKDLESVSISNQPDEQHYYTIVNKDFVIGQTLGEEADPTPKIEAEKLELESVPWNMSWGEREERTRIQEEYYKSGIYITELINESDLVIVPKELASKIKQEVPHANIALIGNEFKPIEKDEEDYPKVILEKSKQLMDRQTLEDLFEQKEAYQGSLFRRRAYEPKRKEIPFLKQVIDVNQDKFTNPQERSAIKKAKHSQIFGKEEIKITTNLYGIGRNTNYQGSGPLRISAKNYLTNIREQKIDEVIINLHKMWTKTKSSLDDIHDRQSSLEQLIEDEGYYNNIKLLAEGLNQLIEPYIHLSSMSQLITTNIMKSGWTGWLHKNTFYKDFIRIAREFNKQYEQIKGSLQRANPKSREIQVIIKPLELMLKENGELDRTNEFIKKVLDDKPENYEDLRKIYEEKINQLGLELIPELEEYIPRLKGNYKVNDETIDEYKASRIMRKKRSRLEGFKSPKLKRLFKKFHANNPIKPYECHVPYLSYAGTKLIGFSMAAEYIKNEGWAKPEILTGEKLAVDIINGWYPLTRLQNTDEIVKNDTLLNQEECIEIIEGTNAGGKTIDAKKTLYIAALAHTGNFVPAEQAKVSKFDKIIYRKKGTGHYDSALRSELRGLEHIIDHLGMSMLIGLDETFTSTNNLEGEALTYALVKRLSQSNNVRLVITSHYIGLRDLLSDPLVNRVKFSHFDYTVRDGQIKFPYKKLAGMNPRLDYALTIAENEKISKQILNHARSVLENE